MSNLDLMITNLLAEFSPKELSILISKYVSKSTECVNCGVNSEGSLINTLGQYYCPNECGPTGGDYFIYKTEDWDLFESYFFRTNKKYASLFCLLLVKLNLYQRFSFEIRNHRVRLYGIDSYKFKMSYGTNDMLELCIDLLVGDTVLPEPCCIEGKLKDGKWCNCPYALDFKLTEHFDKYPMALQPGISEIGNYMKHRGIIFPEEKGETVAIYIPANMSLYERNFMEYFEYKFKNGKILLIHESDHNIDEWDYEEFTEYYDYMEEKFEPLYKDLNDYLENLPYDSPDGNDEEDYNNLLEKKYIKEYVEYYEHSLIIKAKNNNYLGVNRDIDNDFLALIKKLQLKKNTTQKIRIHLHIK